MARDELLLCLQGLFPSQVNHAWKCLLGGRLAKSAGWRAHLLVLGCEGKSVELLALFTMRFGAKSSTDLPLMPCTSYEYIIQPALSLPTRWQRKEGQTLAGKLNAKTTTLGGGLPGGLRELRKDSPKHPCSHCALVYIGITGG